MTDLTEKVARALCLEHGDPPECWEDHISAANVALDIVLEDAMKAVAVALRSMFKRSKP